MFVCRGIKRISCQRLNNSCFYNINLTTNSNLFDSTISTALWSGLSNWNDRGFFWEGGHLGSILHNHAVHSRRFCNFLEGSLALSTIEASKFLSWDKGVERTMFLINTSSLAQSIRVFQTEFSIQTIGSDRSTQLFESAASERRLVLYCDCMIICLPARLLNIKSCSLAVSSSA